MDIFGIVPPIAALLDTFIDRVDGDFAHIATMARPRAYKLKGSYGEFNGSKVYYLGFERQPGFLPASGRGFAGLMRQLIPIFHRAEKE